MVLDKRNALLMSSGFIGGACLLYILCNALTSWGTESGSGGSVTLGIWKTCGKSSGIDVCISLNCDILVGSVCGKMMVARAFVTLACILSALATLLLIFWFLQGDNTPSGIVRSAKILPTLTFMIGLIGVAVGISFAMTDTGTSLGVASYLGLVAIALNLGAAICAITIRL